MEAGELELINVIENLIEWTSVQKLHFVMHSAQQFIHGDVLILQILSVDGPIF